MRKAALAIVCLIVVVTGAVPTRRYCRSVAALVRIEDARQPHTVAKLFEYQVDEQPAAVKLASGNVAARLYVPRGLKSAPGLVVLHGIHHLGIDEPRLVNFSRVMAASGYVVLTPEMPALADYRIEPGSIAIIGAAARQLSSELRVQRVGVLGLSFAGGLALLADADPQWSRSIAYVAAIGAHDELARVLRFFVTNSAPEPDGATLRLEAHEYGALVVVYDHPEDFFSASDVPVARESLRLLLWEQPNNARVAAEKLSPQGKALMEALLRHDRSRIMPIISDEIAKRAGDMAAASPAGHLGSIHTPVLLLHGAGDTVIPPSETLWLAHELPADALREVLISPAISHVEVKQPSFRDKLQLVHWMAALFHAADATPEGKAPGASTGSIRQQL